MYLSCAVLLICVLLHCSIAVNKLTMEYRDLGSCNMRFYRGPAARSSSLRAKAESNSSGPSTSLRAAYRVVWLLVFAGIFLSFNSEAEAQSDPAPYGNHDGATCQVFTGWACDDSNPTKPVTLHFYDGWGFTAGYGNYIGSVLANQSRGDVAAAGFCRGNAYHGFTFTWPDRRADGKLIKDGQPHTIVAYALGIDGNGNRNGAVVNIWNTGKSVTCGDDGGALRAADTSAVGGTCGYFADVHTNANIDQSTKDGIEFMGCRLVLGGYPCGGPNEPCDSYNSPYFRPSKNISRGQLAKIVVNAHDYDRYYPWTRGQVFTDVKPGDPFYDYAHIAWFYGLMDVPKGTTCGVYPQPCEFKPGISATRAEAAYAIITATQYDDAAFLLRHNVTPSFADVNTWDPEYMSIEIGYRRGLWSGYSGSLFNPSHPLTRAQFSKMSTNARFYHVGIPGYSNLTPYRGSPNFEYGAGFNPPRPTDLRTIPSGELLAAQVDTAINSFKMKSVGVLWTPEHKNWLHTFPDGLTPAWESSGAYDVDGTHPCPPGHFGTTFVLNFPSGFVQYENLPPCTFRVIIANPGGIVANSPQYGAEYWWIAPNSTSGRIQTASVMVSCPSGVCGRDIQRADLLAHFCYTVGSNVVRCATNP